MNSIDTNRLREWHRLAEHEQVIEALALVDALQPDQQLLLGLAQMMNGDNEAGRETLAPVLDIPPADDGWRSDAALANMLLGNISRAEQYLLEIIHSDGGACAVDYGRLAAVKLAQNDIPAAIDHYTEAVNREPGREHWHHNLASSLYRNQQLDEALEHYRIAIGINPEFERAAVGKRQVLAALERTAELVEDLEAQLEAEPERLPIRLQLARAYTQDNRLSDALRCLREPQVPMAELLEKKEQEPEEFAELKDEQIALRSMQAELLTQRSRYQMALKKWDEVLELEPETRVLIDCARVNALSEMRQYEEAEEILEVLLEEHPEEKQVKIAKSHLLTESGRFEEAEALLRDLLETYPGNANFLTTLGQTLLWVGKLDEAAECFEKASEINPMALAQMVKARRYPSDPAAIEKMESIADNPVAARESRINMGFALGELHDKTGNYERAFHYLDNANRLSNATLNYLPDQFSRRVDAITKVFSKEYFEQLPPIRLGERTPVFVVGMPRSGTTLTEQILCSHKDVFGAGELELLAVLTRLMPRVFQTRQQFPACMGFMTLTYREEAARYYLYGISQHNEDKPFVVDKMPHNFTNLGLIAAILPGARIIHVRRDPRDTALSNYQQNFKAKDGGMGYAFDLENIARQINDYHRIMEHWREVLPVPMFEMNYDELVQDQEGISRELLNYIGVDWDDSVTDFHRTERAVRTASVSQVRQPIYKTSSQKWRRYEEFLGPLLDNLDPAVLKEWS